MRRIIAFAFVVGALGFTAALARNQQPTLLRPVRPTPILRWSSAGPIAGLSCTKFGVLPDANGWNDNYLCAAHDLALRWSNEGPIPGMACTAITEPEDGARWDQTHLCAPTDQGFRWSHAGPLPGLQCLPIHEEADPHGWRDNHLCWPRAGIGPLDAVPVPPTSRTDIINLIRLRHGYERYLEIGQEKGRNYDLVGARVRVGVDPDRTTNAAYHLTSDEFFTQNRQTFDLIFIDGLHHAEQVERDMLNALRVLNPGGTIVMHDCNPTAREYQEVPPAPGVPFWTGDVWKPWVKFRATRPDLRMYVIDLDMGVGVITRGSQQTVPMPASLTYDALAANRRALLNLVPVSVFLKEMLGQS